MEDSSLDQILEFNEFLSALDQAGVPLQLSRSGSSVSDELRQINEGLLLRARLGQDLPQALEDNEQLPKMYRWAVQAGLDTGKWSSSLESLSRPARSNVQLQKSLGLSLVQPLLVLVLAYFGFLLFCNVLAPEVNAMYAQMRQEPSFFAQALNFSRQTMQVWGIALPMLFVVLVVWWKLCPGIWTALLPGRSRYQRNVRQATVAELTATLVESGVPQATAVRVACLANGGAERIELPEHNATADADVAATSASHRTLPPLVACALAMPYSADTTPQLLRVAAGAYRGKAKVQSGYWHDALPTLLAALLGGVVVLLYGLSVFGTMSQLLKDVAS